jgi:hypothetical protein
MIPDEIVVWGIQYSGGRKSGLWGVAYRTRKDAKAAFLKNWSTSAEGLKRLKAGHYRIVKLYARVADETRDT